MFDDYVGFINLDIVLKDKYQYSVGDIQSFYQQDFVEIEGNGKDARCWIKYGNDRFLFKAINNFDYNVWGELLSERVAKLLGIPCASYRVGELCGSKGVISKSFLRNDDTLIIGSQLFEKYYYNNMDKYQMITGDNKKKLFRSWNNYVMIQQILGSFSNLSFEKKDSIFRFLFGLVTLQLDNHAGNWGFILRDGKMLPSELYDNSSSFGLGSSFVEKLVVDFRSDYFNSRMFSGDSIIMNDIYKFRSAFFYSIDDIVDKNNFLVDIIPNIFENFLHHISIDDVVIVDEFFKKVNEIKLETIISKLELDNGIKMDDKVLFYIINVFEKNVEYLGKIFLKFKKEVFNDEKRGRG